MTFAAPIFLAAGAAVAAGVLLLHLLAWRRPPAAILPTARFVPERSLRTAARSLRPSDVWLLALRILIVLLVAAALAEPRREPRRSGSARVVVLDRSRAVADVTDGAARARTLLASGGALVLVDSVAHAIRDGAIDSLGAVRRVDAAGSLSAALIVAVREARRLEERHDAVEIVLVSPLAEEEIDSATRLVRATWPQRLRLERLTATAIDSQPPRVFVRADGDDGIAAAVRLAGWDADDASASTRLVRDRATSADSAWAAASARTLLLWPAAGVGAVDSTPVDSTSVASGGMVARSATFVGPLVRLAAPPPGRVVARWLDGAPAVTEASIGAGCVRTVAASVGDDGDLTLTPSFRRLLGELASPCGGRRHLAAIDDAAAESLLVAPGAAIARAGVPSAAQDRGSLATMMLIAAFLLALVEMSVRDRRRSA